MSETPLFDALTAAHLIGSIDWDRAEVDSEGGGQ